MDNNFVFDTTKFVLGEVKKRGFKNCNGGACRAEGCQRNYIKLRS